MSLTPYAPYKSGGGGPPAAIAVILARVGLSRHNLNLGDRQMTDDRSLFASCWRRAGDRLPARVIGFAAERLMELETDGLCGAGPASAATVGAITATATATVTGRPGRHGRAPDPQTAPRQLLPPLPGAAERGEGPDGRDPGSLGRGHLHPQRRQPGAGDGHGGDQQEPGLEALQGDRRARRRLSLPADRRRVALSLAGRDLRQSPRRRPHRLGRRYRRRRGQHRRPPRGPGHDRRRQ